MCKLKSNELAMYLRTPLGTARPNVIRTRPTPRVCEPTPCIALVDGVRPVFAYPVLVTVKKVLDYAHHTL